MPNFFVRCISSHGSDDDWKRLSHAIRHAMRRRRYGRARHVSQDTSEDGCYCEDAHLRQLLKSRQFSESSAAETAVTAEAGRHQDLEAVP